MTDNQSEKDWIRKAAREEVESLKLIRATLWEEHTDSFRWLMASLLAINGAGLWSGFGADEASSIIRFASGGAFLLGMLTALLIAVFGQRSAQASFGPINECIGYWISVADDGERIEELEATVMENLKPATNIAANSRIFGWVSAFAFVVGVSVPAFGEFGADSTEASKPTPIEAMPLPQNENPLQRGENESPILDDMTTTDADD